MLARIARQWGLMNEMSRKAGVDLGAAFIDGRLSRADLQDAVFTCTRCTHAPDCECFLDGERGAPGEIPDYCLNRPMILALKAQ